MSQKNFVELRNVTKRFGSNTVIDTINLTIPQGQMVTLLGPSGCGKTTILRLVAGLEKPSEGQIFIDGETLPIARFSSAISAWCFSLTPCSRICRWGITSATV
jgi:ABC-type Fe3+/spermidine/putrescine transport system ATPase subunit